MIWLIILAFFAGGLLMTVVISCFAYNSYNRGYNDGYTIGFRNAHDEDET